MKNTPTTLTRPLATRINDLPDVVDQATEAQVPQAVIDLAIKALDDGKTHYTDRPGILPLRQWVCDHLKTRFDLSITPDQVTITCGRTEAQFVTVKLLAQTGSQIYCPSDPSAIAGMAHLASATIVDAVDNPSKISLAYLTPNDDKFIYDEAVTFTEQHDWWLMWDMLDGADADFHPAQNADIASRVITIGALPAQMDGWRIGWMAGSEMATKLRAYKQSMTICSTSISQWASLGLAENS